MFTVHERLQSLYRRGIKPYTRIPKITYKLKLKTKTNLIKLNLFDSFYFNFPLFIYSFFQLNWFYFCLDKAWKYTIIFMFSFITFTSLCNVLYVFIAFKKLLLLLFFYFLELFFGLLFLVMLEDVVYRFFKIW